MADDKPIKVEKALNKNEQFVCEILWGGVPLDVQWVRNSKMFIEGMRKFEQGEYNKTIDYVKK